MEKDPKKKTDTKKELKQLNDTIQIDRVGIFVDANIDELDKIAKKKEPNQNRLVIVAFFIIFVGVCITTYFQVSSYYEREKLLKNSSSIVEVTSKNDKLTISNNSEVPLIDAKNLAANKVTETTVENNSKLTLEVDKKAKSKSTHLYNIRYRIKKNDYNYLTTVNEPEVLVRFAYSIDGANWNYVNSALSTTNSTLTPQMGNYYDVTGLQSTINVVTNYEITGESDSEVVIYWKAETLFKHLDNEDNQKTLKEYNATFNVEYIN